MVLGKIQTFLKKTPICSRVYITPHSFVINKPRQYYIPYIIQAYYRPSPHRNNLINRVYHYDHQ